jgi:hypothetical protein
MTKDDQYKDQICRLYRQYNLEDVMAIMEKQYGFEARFGVLNSLRQNSGS